MPMRRSILASATSVSLFPEDRILPITSARFALVKTSDIGRLTKGGGQFDATLQFFRQVDEHPVKDSTPLRIARI
jgi:hypothetical protein